MDLSEILALLEDIPEAIVTLTNTVTAVKGASTTAQKVTAAATGFNTLVDDLQNFLKTL